MHPDQVKWVKAKCANYERDNLEPLTPKFTSADGLTSAQFVMIDLSEKNDPIVEGVRQKLLSRSGAGLVKYNTTLHENNKDNYLNHLQQELMDGANYIEKLLQQQEDITQLINKYPNNTELGEIIRKKYGGN